MTRKAKKVASRPEPFSGDRKLRSKIAGIPENLKAIVLGNPKEKLSEIKGECSKSGELHLPNENLDDKHREKADQKPDDHPVIISCEEEKVVDEDLDEFDQVRGELGKEELHSEDQKTNEEVSENEEISDDETSDDEQSDDEVSDEENGSGDSSDETKRSELEKNPLNTRNLTTPSSSIITTAKTPNDMEEGVAGGNLTGKSSFEAPVTGTANGDMETDPCSNMKLSKVSLSTKKTGKTTNDTVKHVVGKNGDKVNQISRTRDSAELRTRAKLKNTLHNATMLTIPSNAKNNARKTSNESILAGKTQTVGTAKNVSKNTTIVAGTDRLTTGKRIQGSISCKTASINKNEISRNSDDHTNAVSNLDNEEDVVEEGCDADSSDDDTTILEVFDAIGSKNEETAKNPHETGSKVLPISGILAKPNPEAQKSFAQLFKSENAKKNGYKLQYVCNDELNGDLMIEDEDVGETSQVWGHSLIGYIAGKNPSYKAVIGYCKAWTHKCRVHFDASGWIVVKFEKEEDLKKVLEGGPYLIYGKPFIIKKMPKYFCFDKSEICKAQVWVNLPHLPLELWNEKALSKIGSRVGEPIQVDSITATMERASFARILVEVDLSKELINDIPLILPNGKRIVQEVRYEYVPAYCEDCKAIGHDTKMCAMRRKQLEVSKTKEIKKDLVGATAENALKPKAASSESVSLKVSTIPTFDASSSKPSKDFNLEKIDEDSEDGFVEYLSKNQRKALAKGKKKTGKEDYLDIDIISAGINKAASRWQKKTKGPIVEASEPIVEVIEPCGVIEPIVRGSCVETGSTSCVEEPEGEGTAKGTRKTLVTHDQGKEGALPRPSR